jgi:hypothetical protein
LTTLRSGTALTDGTRSFTDDALGRLTSVAGLSAADLLHDPLGGGAGALHSLS